MKKIITGTLLIICLLPFSLNAQQLLEGNWEGLLGERLTIKTHFKKTNSGYSGTLDIPQQSAFGLRLQNLKVTEEDSVFFEFESNRGPAEFKGVFKSDSTIAGLFYQAGYEVPFKLHKVIKEKTEQKQDEALNYYSKNLIIKRDSSVIAGTLTYPKNTIAEKGVILISGSGSQTRNENAFGFKIFEQIADYLSSNGIAVFRFDDRGIGGSTGSHDVPLEVLAADVKAIHSFLKQKEKFKNTEIGLLGHSQGGLIAGKLAASYDEIPFIVLMASPGVSLKKILRFQIRQPLRRSGFTDQEIEKEIAAREAIMEANKNEGNVEKAKAAYRSQFVKTRKSMISVPIEKLDSLAHKQSVLLAKAYSGPLMQSLLFYNPVKDLRQLTIPVLVLFGGKDTQVPVEMNRAPIHNALESADVKYEIKVFEDANHLFQKAETGLASEYATLEKEFINGFLPAINRWIKELDD